MDLETVYVTYWNRLQHSVFLSFLLLASSVTTAFLVIAVLSGSGYVSFYYHRIWRFETVSS